MKRNKKRKRKRSLDRNFESLVLYDCVRISGSGESSDPVVHN